MIITTQYIRKWGNGTGVRLPRNVVDAAHLELGQSVAVELRGRSIVLTPIETVASRLPSLTRLLEGVTPDQIGGEVSWGADRGAEALDA